MRDQARGFPRILERRLRAAQTDAERLVWGMLRARRLDGLKFRRQHPVGDDILDFYCPQMKLAVELDGKRHFSEWGRRADELRDEELGQLGITVLHFENSAVIADPQIVSNAILRFRDGRR